MSNYWSTLTDFGTSAVTTAIANSTKINITKVVLGDGVLTDVATDKSRTALKNKVWESATAPSIAINPDNGGQIIVEIAIPANVGGWTVREVGLLDNNSKLIAIAKVAPFDKPTTNQGQSTEYMVKVVLAVSNTSAVSLNINTSVVTASQDFVQSEMAKKANKNLDNVSTSDFRSAYDKLGITFKGNLPITIFTQVSGKFFVRNADGTLPAGIDTSKVWSLAAQKATNGGPAPNGKIHIELPVGATVFRAAGAGGSGGSAFGAVDNNGKQGGSTTITFDSSTNAIATGGRRGYGAPGENYGYDLVPLSCTINNLSGFIKYEHGGYGGACVKMVRSSGQAAKGMNGNLVTVVKTLSTGDVIDYTVGAGGAAGIKAQNGNFLGQKGGDGWIEVEYV